MVGRILIIAALFLVGAWYMYRAVSMRIKSEKAKAWPQAKGKIISSSVEEDNLRNAMGKVSNVYVASIAYEYTVNGELLKGSKVTFGHPVYDYLTASRIRDKYPVDSEINVPYDPENPAESVLVPYAKDAIPSLIPGIFFLAAGIAVAIFVALYS